MTFTVNFLNTKGTNAALLEYSIQFLKGDQTVMTGLPTQAIVTSALAGEHRLGEGEAASLAADDVTAIWMEYYLGSMKDLEEFLMEVDSVQFAARLWTGQDIKVELFQLTKMLSE